MLKVFPDPSKGGRTRQSEKDACDVNVIVASHRRGAIPTHVVDRVGQYGFVPALDFRACMEEVRKADEAFAALPAATRDFFQNDPGRFVEYVSTSENRDELLKLGLVIAPEKVDPALGSAENPIHVAAPAASGSGLTGAGGTPARP